MLLTRFGDAAWAWRVGVVLIGLALLSLAALRGQGTQEGSQWWPSEWGPADQRGAANRITPGKVLEAAQLIREGKIYSLGRVYEPGMPLGGRRYELKINQPTFGRPGVDGELVGQTEVFSGHVGHIGTQFDGLGHVGIRVGDDGIFYNGFKCSQFSKEAGLQKLGVEQAGVFFTRGVLVDVAGSKGLERLEIGYAITVTDVQEALQKQGVRIRTGDVVLIRTGHSKLWKVDNATYLSGEPGIEMEAGRWLADRKIAMVGADNWAVEVRPLVDPDPYPVHQLMLARSGIYLLENLSLEELAADGVYEFAFVFAPVPFKGATGSPGHPIAVR